VDRRTFLSLGLVGLVRLRGQGRYGETSQVGFDLAALERKRVLAAARYLKETPLTITASSSTRSAGGRHDFFSEADYWWPDPANPSGPYIQLLYSQAIQGRVTGRGIGIIDTVHLVEVARAIPTLADSPALSAADRSAVREWFSQYLTWMTTHQYGIDEREARNNHGTCWVMQVAEFARYTGRDDLSDYCRNRYKTVLLPNQVAADGSFPEELRRTKPYGYSLFNLDAMTTVCQIVSTKADDLWRYELPDGRGIKKAVAFLFPYIADKKSWPHKSDVMYHDEWPMRHPALLFAGLALGEQKYVDLWRKLPADSTVEEVIRNFFVRQPVLWVTNT
jgi:hypothetical protein